MALGDDVKAILNEQVKQGNRLARIEERLHGIDTGVIAGAMGREKCQEEVFRRIGRCEKVLAVICSVPAIAAATAGAVWGIAKALKGLGVAAMAWWAK